LQTNIILLFFCFVKSTCCWTDRMSPPGQLKCHQADIYFPNPDNGL